MSYGPYETIREIAQGPIVTVYETRRAGDSGAAAFVVKVCRPAELIEAAESADLERQLLDQARVQERASAGGAAHWAKIHQVGQGPEGAWYATDRYELNAGQLTRGLANLNDAVLTGIIRGVVEGLHELRETCGRPHGNLKPSNVLISRGGRPEDVRIGLCDPLPSSKIDVAGHVAADLRSVGELIFGLVRHKAWAGPASGPAEPGPDWDKLGAAATWWRELCNGLCLPEPGEAYTLDRLREHLAARRVRKTNRLARVGGVAAAIIVLGIGIYLVIPGSGPVIEGDCVVGDAQWNALCDALAPPSEARPELGWLAAVAETLRGGDGPAAKLHRSDETLRALASICPADEDALEKIDPRRLANAPHDSPSYARDHPERMTGPARLAARDGAAMLTEIRGVYADWLAGRASIVRDLEMVTAAGWLERLGEAARSEDGRDWPEAWAALRVMHETSVVDEVIDAVAAMRRPIAEDRVLERFEDLLADELDARVGNVDHLVELGGRLEQLMVLRGRLAARIAEPLDRAAFEREEYERILSRPTTTDTFDVWLALSEQFRPIAEPRPSRGVLEGRLAAAQGLLDEARGLGNVPRSTIETIQGRLESLRRDDLPALLAPPPVKRYEIEIPRLLAGFETSMRSLEENVKVLKEGTREQVARLRERHAEAPFRVAALNSDWTRRWAGETVTERTFFAVQARTDALQEVFDALDERAGAAGDDDRIMPDKPRWLDRGALTAAVQANREAAISSIGVSASIDQVLDDEQRRREFTASIDESVAWKTYRAWVDRAAASAAALVDVDRALAAAADADEIARRYDASAIDDVPGLKDAVGSLVDDVTAVRDAAGGRLGPDALADLIETSNTPAVVRAAWLARDGEPPSRDPKWFTDEPRLARTVEVKLGKVPGRAEDLQADLRRALKDRWIKVAAVIDPRDFDAAARTLADFGFSPQERFPLQPRLDFNVMLYRLRGEVAAATEDEGRDRVRAFIAAARGLAGLRDRAAVDGLLDDLQRIAEGGGGIDLGRIGPGSAGWTLTGSDNETYAAYSRGNGYELAFRLHQGFAIACDEMPVGLFIDLVGEGGIPAGLVEPKRDIKAGRVWEWAGAMRVASSWIDSEAARDYYGNAPVPPPPSREHPVQRVGPAAAAVAAHLLGCRLPTSDEWSVAARASNDPRPNRRDAAFDLVDGHAKARRDAILAARQMNGPDLYPPPDIGAFEKQDGALPGNDGTVWFVPTQPGDRSRAHNLVGNVAEWVFDDSGALDAASAGRQGTAAVRQAIEGSAGRVRVIGASAMSPAVVAPETAVALRGLAMRAGINNWYSDVGFRVAFTLDQSLKVAFHEDVRRTLAAAAYQ